MTQDQILQLVGFLIPILAPIITAFLKKILPSLPKLAIVILQPILGMLISVFTPIDPATGAVLGASGIAVREAIDQGTKFARSLYVGAPVPRVGDRKNLPPV